MRKLSVAHFAEWGPSRCGMYGTVRDLIQGERVNGLDAHFFNVTVDKEGRTFCPKQIHWDGDFCNSPIHFAENCDIFVRHSIIPKDLRHASKIKFMALHGRPESSFRLDLNGKRRVFTEEVLCSEKKEYAKYLYFWPEYHTYWKHIIDGERLAYIPSMVNLDRFTPEGDAWEFSEKRKGNPNILVPDIWREDEIPFNVLFAAVRFCERYAPEGKIHLLGAPIKEQPVKILINLLKRTGYIGEVGGVVGEIEKFYRACDMVLTPHIIATRVVRETLACNTPLVAGEGCTYTPFTANPKDIKEYTKAIARCWTATKDSGGDAWNTLARRWFDPVQAGKIMKNLCEKQYLIHKLKGSFNV